MDTDECRAFNARLWAEELAERAREADELRQREQGRAGGRQPPDSEVGLAAEAGARAQAQRELEQLSKGRTPAWVPTGLGGAVGIPLLFVGLGIGTSGLLLALFHRGSVGGWLLVVAVAALLLAAFRRAT
ncbi:MAG: hypothetical protein ACLPJH_10295 [Myxococcaceae bacterium]